MGESLTSVATPRRARNLAESVCDYVIEQIESAALKPGDKLPTEAKLMLTLGVSRSSSVSSRSDGDCFWRARRLLVPNKPG